jgi:hypothetical protein
MKTQLRIKILFLLLTVGICINCFSQSRLNIINPSPRIGDDVDVSFELEKDGKKYGYGNIKLTDATKNLGKCTIGPFSFSISQMKFETNNGDINVAPKLPDDPEGVWIRHLKSNGIDFLIVEQCLPVVNKVEKSTSTELSVSTNRKRSHFEFKQELFEEKGFEIISVNSSIGIRSFGKEVKTSKEFSHKILIVKFRKDSAINKKERINKVFFENLNDDEIKKDVWID